MRAISAFNLEAGMSTRVCFECTALRMRVSMSAIGSVMSVNLLTWVTLQWRAAAVGGHATAVLFPLPAALCHTGDVAVERQLAEAQPAQRKLPDVRTRAAA